MKRIAQFVSLLLGRGWQEYLFKLSSQQQRLIDSRAEVDEKVYDFFRCYTCRRLITKLDEMAMFDPTSETYGVVCPCGSRRYTPTNLLAHEWAYPRVWKFAFVRILEVA